MTSDDIIAAQVAIRPDYYADPHAVTRAFETAGFSTSPPFTGNFAITAPRSVFERFFHVDLSGAVSELPLAALPPALRQMVAAIVFTRTDFGPTSY